jgi:K+ transporter
MLTIEGYVSLTKGEFMKNMFLLSAALLMIIGNKALAADGGTMGSDNIVEVRMLRSLKKTQKLVAQLQLIMLF